jgi:hypothetical protein
LVSGQIPTLVERRPDHSRDSPARVLRRASSYQMAGMTMGVCDGFQLWWMDGSYGTDGQAGRRPGTAANPPFSPGPPNGVFQAARRKGLLGQAAQWGRLARWIDPQASGRGKTSGSVIVLAARTAPQRQKCHAARPSRVVTLDRHPPEGSEPNGLGGVTHGDIPHGTAASQRPRQQSDERLLMVPRTVHKQQMGSHTPI